jgi:hypothetical protein
MSLLSLMRHLNARANQVVLLAQEGLPEPVLVREGLLYRAERDLNAEQLSMWRQWNQGVFASSLKGNRDLSILQFRLRAFGNGQNFVLQIEYLAQGLYRMVLYADLIHKLSKPSHFHYRFPDALIHEVPPFISEGSTEITEQLTRTRRAVIKINCEAVFVMIQETFEHLLGLESKFLAPRIGTLLVLQLINLPASREYNILVGIRTDGVDILYLEIAHQDDGDVAHESDGDAAHDSEMGLAFRKMASLTSTAMQHGSLNLNWLVEECAPLIDAVHELLGEATTPRHYGP